MELSVTEYAKRLGVTRSAVLLQIKEKRLPKNVTVKKIGNTYSLSVRGQKNKKKSFEMLHNYELTLKDLTSDKITGTFFCAIEDDSEEEDDVFDFDSAEVTLVIFKDDKEIQIKLELE